MLDEACAWLDAAVRILSALAAIVLLAAGVTAVRNLRVPGGVIRGIRACYVLLCALPATFLLAMLALALRVRWTTGDWPHSGRLDFIDGEYRYESSTLELFEGHLAVAYLLGMLAAFAILWAIPAYALLRAGGRRPHPTWMTALVVGTAFTWLMPPVFA